MKAAPLSRGDQRLHPWPWPAVWQYVPLVARGFMRGHVCLDLCKSITTSGKSTVSSHPAGGQISCAIVTITGQQVAVHGQQMSVPAGVE